ncbi:hypothetical protein FQN54_004427 [Arachnomyces sp. PD_36]|nr:hypothetical protein FQN54_004427 [Arachnomyces sp. PD_36]
MLLPRTHLRRIPPLVRPLKPPRQLQLQLHHNRPFTSNTQLLLLLSPPTVKTHRPQLPFLHQKPSHSSGPGHGNHHHGHPSSLQPINLYRLLSTSPRAQYYRRTITGGLKLGIGFYLILWMVYLIQYGFKQEIYERKFPTPRSWGWYERWGLRSARAKCEEEDVDVKEWMRVGEYVREMVGVLEGEVREDAKRENGEEGEVLVDGLGRVAIDVSGKDEPWRRGYFQALMCAAKIAENLDNIVIDKTVMMVAKRDQVFPTTLPNGEVKYPPRAISKTGKGEMKPENCTPVYEAPEVFYMKILTGKGFGTRQKVDAALGYADWLDFKGLGETAREVYDWGMDVAVRGMEEEVAEGGREVVKGDGVIDSKTGVLTGKGTEYISENVMRVSTALAVHHAKVGELPTALSIFLSLLRARRDINSKSPAPSPPSTTQQDQQQQEPSSILSTLSSLLTPPPFPPPPPSGNTPPPSPSPCSEAALMTYIGEIIFASSSHEAGLAWTRDAVDLAEAGLFDTPSQGEYAKCIECLDTSLDNWKTMLKTLVRQAEDREVHLIQNPSGRPAWPMSLWYGEDGGDDERLRVMARERRRWEAEEMVLQERFRGLSRVVAAGNRGKGLWEGLVGL